MKLSEFEPQYTSETIALFTQVFSDSEGESEGKLIGDLVSNLITTTPQEDLIGFVAQTERSIVASVFFSRLILPSSHVAFILSPMAVCPSVQGKGIGQQLINFGISHLTSLKVERLFTYGDPAFYSKVGFEPISEDIVQAPHTLSYPHGWLAQSLNNQPITVMTGASKCVNALDDQQYW